MNTIDRLVGERVRVKQVGQRTVQGTLEKVCTLWHGHFVFTVYRVVEGIVAVSFSDKRATVGSHGHIHMMD